MARNIPATALPEAQDADFQVDATAQNTPWSTASEDPAAVRLSISGGSRIAETPQYCRRTYLALLYIRSRSWASRRCEKAAALRFWTESLTP